MVYIEVDDDDDVYIMLVSFRLGSL